MLNLKVYGVVRSCYEYTGHLDYYAKIGIKQLLLPVIDHEEPSVEDMKEAVKFTKTNRESG